MQSPATSAPLLALIFNIGISLPAAAMSQSPADEPSQPENNIYISEEIALSYATPISDLNIQIGEWQTPPQPLTLWQGMDHEWRRFIVAPNDGRIPHRISSLSNFLQPDSTGQWQATFAQDTGVDGNYMHPLAYGRTLEGVDYALNKVSFSWKDNLQESEHSAGGVPQARNKVRYLISVPASSEAQQSAQLQPSQLQPPQLALQGIDLSLDCQDADQPADKPCNSNGLWPYLLALQLGQCELAVDQYLCPLEIDIYRSWTPNQGGVPGIGETKPLNQQLGYQLDIHLVSLTGDDNDIAFSSPQTVQHSHDLLNYQGINQPLEMLGKPRYAQGVALIKGFGFMLTKPEKVGGQWLGFNPDLRQRGRYLAKVQFAVNNVLYHAKNSTLSLSPDMHIWAPETVVDSRAHSMMKLQLLQFQGQQAPLVSAKGQLCLNSKPGAPFYSLWKNCDRQTKAARQKFGGVERARQTIPLISGESE